MKAKRRVLGMLVVAGVLACCASSCVYKPVQMGVPLFGSESLKGKRLVRLGEGEACSSLILFAIPVGDDSMETAIERLMQATGSKTGWSPDMVTVEQGQSFWLLGSSSCTRLVGYGAKPPATKFKSTIVSSPTPGEPAAADAPAAETGAP